MNTIPCMLQVISSLRCTPIVTILPFSITMTGLYEVTQMRMKKVLRDPTPFHEVAGGEGSMNLTPLLCKITREKKTSQSNSPAHEI